MAGIGRARARIKPPTDRQAERDRIALGRIEQIMDDVSQGVTVCPSCKQEHQIKELTPSTVNLLRARYDKLRPSLTAVEQTQIDARDKLNPDELMAALAAKLLEKPNLLIDIIKSKPELHEEFSRQFAQFPALQ